MLVLIYCDRCVFVGPDVWNLTEIAYRNTTQLRITKLIDDLSWMNGKACSWSNIYS